MNKPLYWNEDGGMYTNLALKMLNTTAYAQGMSLSIPSISYEDALNIDND